MLASLAAMISHQSSLRTQGPILRGHDYWKESG
jgi:hypothetical protein